MIKGHLLLTYFILFCSIIKGQILCNFQSYRNTAYIGAGINNSFANTTIGIARVDKFRFSKRKIIGILDVSLPISNKYFTKRSVRKGFQFDAIEGKVFRLPVLIASSSIYRENKYYKIHDITLEVSLSPGIYREKYYFAFDLRYEFILFRHYHYFPIYLSEIDPSAKTHWEEPNNSIGKAGVIFGIDLKRCFFQFKCGYEKYPSTISKLFPAYAVISTGFKFGTKALKNNSSSELH